MIIIIPIMDADIALILGSPGKLINLAMVGLRNATIPKRRTIIPVIKSTMFARFIILSI